MINRRIGPILPSPNHSKPRIIAIAATLAVGLAAAGCGSSSSKVNNASATTATLSRSQFLAQGNAICTRGNQTLATAEKALGKQPSEAQFKTYVANTFAPTIQDQIDGLRALAAPTTDQARVTGMLDVAQTDLNQVKSNPTILTEKTFTDFAELAHPYGLKACAPNN